MGKLVPFQSALVCCFSSICCFTFAIFCGVGNGFLSHTHKYSDTTPDSVLRHDSCGAWELICLGIEPCWPHLPTVLSSGLPLSEAIWIWLSPSDLLNWDPMHVGTKVRCHCSLWLWNCVLCEHSHLFNHWFVIVFGCFLAEGSSTAANRCTDLLSDLCFYILE